MINFPAERYRVLPDLTPNEMAVAIRRATVADAMGRAAEALVSMGVAEILADQALRAQEVQAEPTDVSVEAPTGITVQEPVDELAEARLRLAVIADTSGAWPFVGPQDQLAEVA